jgi:penicillin-binding protein 2
MFSIGHHQIPSSEPHVGTYGNPDGFLTFNEAVQRSCNVYFENIGDRLKMDGLSKWYSRFGLGRKTGLGIAEVKGRLPNQWTGATGDRRFATWISAIGQSSTLATPVQMANVAATIARDGVWVRPRLVKDGQGLQIPDAGEDRVDLKLPRAAVAAAKQGMIDVVNTRAGSAYAYVRRTDLQIAGKTGTAQASPVQVTVRGKDGKPLIDADGKVVRRELAPSSPLKPNDEAPWYRGWGKEGTDLNHSWFIGFAPADKPKIAFAVMLEYGGSGGAGAGLIARDIIDLCVERGYLKVTRPAEDDAQPASSSHPAELLEPVVGD